MNILLVDAGTELSQDRQRELLPHRAAFVTRPLVEGLFDLIQPADVALSYIQYRLTNRNY